MSHGGNKKKIVFYDSDDRHASLKVKLQYHGLTQSAFFREVVSAMIDENDLFLDFLESCKRESSKQSKRQQKLVINERALGDAIDEHFGLKKEEVKNIFDLIEKEHPDL
tara:strand:+ start:168 stop:494 length:327 start_codon:yes stop_codon:yes gene_type:complete